MTVWSIEIRDERDRLVCTSRCTLAFKPGSALAETDSKED
jgi:acyl-coenzyme A thioesterase PaaI-like protein